MSNAKQINSGEKSVNATSNTNLHIRELKTQVQRPIEHVGNLKCGNLKDKLTSIPISITIKKQVTNQVQTQSKIIPLIARTSPVPTASQNKPSSPTPQQLSPSDYSVKSNRSPTNPNPILNIIGGCNRSNSNNSYHPNNYPIIHNNMAINKNPNNYRLANNNILFGISKKNIKQNVDQQTVARLSPQIEPTDGKRFQFDFRKNSIASNTSNLSNQKNSIKSGTSKVNLNIQVHDIDKANKSKNMYKLSQSKDKNSMIDINKRLKNQFLTQLNNYNKLAYIHDGNESSKKAIQHKHMNSVKKYSYQLYHPTGAEQQEQVYNHKRYHTIDSGQNCFQDFQMSKFKKQKPFNSHSINQSNNNHQIINKPQRYMNTGNKGYTHTHGKQKQRQPRNQKLETLNIIDGNQVQHSKYNNININNGIDNVSKNKKKNVTGKNSKKLLDVDMFLSNYNTNKNNNIITSPPKKTPQIAIAHNQKQLLKSSSNLDVSGQSSTILSQKNTIIQKLHQYLNQKNKELQQERQQQQHHNVQIRAELQTRNNIKLGKGEPILNSRLVNLVSHCVSKDRGDLGKSLITVFSNQSSMMDSNTNSSNNSTINSKKNTQRSQNQQNKNIFNDISIQLKQLSQIDKINNSEMASSLTQELKGQQLVNVDRSNNLNIQTNLNSSTQNLNKKGIVNININNICSNKNEKSTSANDMSIIARKFDINSIIKGRRRLKTIQQSPVFRTNQKLQAGKKNSNANIFNTYGCDSKNITLNGEHDIGRYTIYQKLLIDNSAHKNSNMINQQYQNQNDQGDQFEEQYQHQFLSGFGNNNYQVMDQTLEFIIKSHQNQSKGHNQDNKKNTQDMTKSTSGQHGISKKAINQRVSNSKIAILQIQQEIQNIRKMGGNDHSLKQKDLQISKWNHRLQKQRDNSAQNQKERKSSYIMHNKNSRDFNNMMNTSKYTNHF